MTRNNFEPLRRPELAGHLYTGGRYTSQLKIYDRAGALIHVTACRVRDGMWLLGWDIRLPALNTRQEPWEGAGWFRTFDDAVLWLAGALLARRHIDDVPPIRKILHELVRRLSQPALF